MGFALPDIPSPPTLCAPVPAMLLFRTGLATGSPWGLPAVLRTSFIARSLVSRIWPYRVCVVGRHWTHRSTDYLFTFSCSPPHLAVTQLLSVTGGKLHQGGTLTLLRTLTPKRTSAPVLGRSKLRLFQRAGFSRHASCFGRRCARGRARSAKQVRRLAVRHLPIRARSSGTEI